MYGLSISMANCVKGLVIYFGLLSLNGCATPTEKIFALAKSLHINQSMVLGKKFSHAIFLHRLDRVNHSNSVHVYIEGDGKPFLTPSVIARDPTPSEPLALRLMAKDNRPSIYLGRPCYFGFAQSLPCHPKYWTTHRYAPEIIESMMVALNGVLGAHAGKKIVLIGYSGGAPLAMLMAARMPNITTVVTVAGNINIDAWTDHHQFTPMTASINPASQPVLDRRIFQLHFAGERDANVPPPLIEPEVYRQTKGHVVIYENFDHICCWVEAWPDVLQRYGLSQEQGQR